jgi:hypothetical protein
MYDILFHGINHLNNKHQIAPVAALFRPPTIKITNMLQAFCSVPRVDLTMVAKVLLEAKTA